MANKLFWGFSTFLLIILFPTSHTFGIYLHLKEGNVAVGKLPETLPFSTPISNLKIKTSEIVSFKEGRLQLKNGSMLQNATIGLEVLQVQTKVGSISINVKDIEAIEEHPPTYYQQRKVSNKYLIVKNAIELGNWHLPEGTRLTIVSEGRDRIKAMIGKDTFDIARNGEVFRNLKYEDITTPPSNGAAQKSYALINTKKTIAVATFDNNVSIEGEGEYYLTRGMSAQLNHSLIKSGRFVVLSRSLFEEMSAELDMAATANYSSKQGGANETIPWSQILIKGTVTEFDPGVKQTGSGISLMGVDLENTKGEAHVAIIIQIVDTATGQIIDSQRVEGKSKEGGASFNVNTGLLFASLLTLKGGGTGGAFSKIPDISARRETFNKAPLGKATQLCIDNAVKYICKRFADELWQGSVIKLKGGRIYINAGKFEGIKAGMMLSACQGTDLLDPLSGAKLGMDLEEIGKLKVIKVYPKFSECFLIEGYEPEIGDIVVEEMDATRVADSSEHGFEKDDTVWTKLEKLKIERAEGRISEEEFNSLLELLVPGR